MRMFTDVVPSTRMWASVYDQASVVLPNYAEGRPAKRQRQRRRSSSSCAVSRTRYRVDFEFWRSSSVTRRRSTARCADQEEMISAVADRDDASDSNRQRARPLTVIRSEHRVDRRPLSGLWVIAGPPTALTP